MDPIEISAISMKNDLAKLNNISDNVANLTTPGYKKSIALTESFSEQVGQIQGQFSGLNTIGNSAELPTVRMVSDQSAAAMKETDNPLDISLEESNVYFELQNSTGSIYSRRGNFSVDSDGRMYLSGTDAYLNGLGGDIRIGSNPDIDSLGRVFENGDQIAQLKLVRFSENQNLTSIGNGLFSANGLSSENVVDKPIVRQGFLEGSNTEPAVEMLEMVSLVRHMEATQQVIRGYDGMLETALDELGNF